MWSNERTKSRPRRNAKKLNAFSTNSKEFQTRRDIQFRSPLCTWLGTLSFRCSWQRILASTCPPYIRHLTLSALPGIDGNSDTNNTDLPAKSWLLRWHHMVITSSSLDIDFERVRPSSLCHYERLTDIAKSHQSHRLTLTYAVKSA
jgi:hypothetical protein